MTDVKITTNADTLDRFFRELGKRQMPFALSLMANRLGQLVKAGEASVLRQRIDRPKPWTINSLKQKAATKAKPTSEVGFRDVPRFPVDWHYLIPQVGGGGRPLKGFERVLKAAGYLKPNEYMVPASGARMDAYGNMNRGQLLQVMSALRLAEHVSGYTSNASGSARSNRTQKRSGANRYFWAEIEGATGVWQRVDSAFGDGARPVLLVTDSVRYRARYPFDTIAANIIRANYAKVVEDVIGEVAASARR